MKKQFALAVVLAAAPLAAATAGELSYTYAELGYARVDVENEDADGFQLRGSVAVAENVYLFGGHARAEFNDLDVDLSESQLGVGLRSAMGERVDVIAELGYLRPAFENAGTSSSAQRGRLSVGLRGLLADRVEGWAKASYNDGNNDYDGTLSGLVGAQFKFNPTWGLVGEVEHGELLFNDVDTTKYLIGVRASF